MMRAFELPKPVACPQCGHGGFVTEAHARTYAAGQRALGAQVVVLECPKGAGGWHVADTKRKSLECYREMLLEGPPRAKTSTPAETVGDTNPASAEVRSARPCTKIGYARETLARAVLEQAQNEGRAEKDAYACAYCGNWHLTSHDSPQTIVEEDVVVFADLKGSVKVTAGRWPSGELVGITLRRLPQDIYVRLTPEHAAALVRVLAVFLAQ